MAKSTTMRQLLREIMVYLLRYKKLVIAVIALGLLQAIVLKAPMFLLKGVSDTLWPDGNAADPEGIFKYIEDAKHGLLELLGLQGLGSSEATGVAQIGAYLLLLAFCVPLGAITIYGFRTMANLVTMKVTVDLRNGVCRHLMGLSLSYFSKQRSGDLISRVSNDTNTLRHSFTLVLENAIAEPFLLLMNVVIAWVVDPYLGLLVVAMIPGLLFILRKMGRKIRKSSGQSLEALGDATDSMHQMFSGFRTVKAFQLEKQEVDEFARGNLRFLRRTMRMVRAKAASNALTYLLYMLGFAAILMMLAKLQQEGGLEKGDFVLAMVPLSTTYQHVKKLARTYNLLQESRGALDRIKEVTDQVSEIKEQEGAIVLDGCRGEIEFDKVYFSYGSETVLHGLSFRVRPGEKIAFVGPSGAGKSTILDLLARFYDPTGGRILVDGEDLRSLKLESYLKHIATVDQSPFLFNRSIRENILLGKPGATEEEMLKASKLALVDDFAEDLANGYESVVGERGAALSGGQLQRITIARAVIRDPRILLLDEATSALDTESETIVQDALGNLMQGRTSFIIAHRLSTVRGADRIFVIEKGKLVEEGNHDELMAREDSIYRKLKIMQA